MLFSRVAFPRKATHAPIFASFENQGALGSCFSSALPSFVEPLDTWVNVMGDALPFFKDAYFLCPSYYSDQSLSCLRSRCREIFPHAKAGKLREDERKLSGLSTGSGSASRFSGLTPGSARLPSSISYIRASPITKLPPKSQDLIVYAGNVFGSEMLFQSPAHISAAHRALRPHGVLAIVGHTLSLDIVGPPIVKRGIDDFTEMMREDFSALCKEEAKGQRCTPQHACASPFASAEVAKEMMDSMSLGHGDIYFPFPAVKRRWFQSEYELSPSEVTAFYRLLPMYSHCYSARMSKNGEMGEPIAFEDFLLPSNADFPSSVPSTVVVRRSVDPVDVLLRWLSTSMQSLQAKKIRARMLHFVVTCSTRGCKSVGASRLNPSMGSGETFSQIPFLQSRGC